MGICLPFWACKKPIEIRPQSNFLSIAKDYFETQQKKLFLQNNPIQRNNDARLDPKYRTFYPDWQKAEISQLPNGNSVLIVPIWREYRVIYPNDLYFIRRLRIEFSPTGQVLKGNIVELITNKSTIAQQKNHLIGNIFEAIKYTNQARINIFDMDYQLEQNNKTWRAIEAEYCYEYYLVNICGLELILQMEVPCPHEPINDDSDSYRSEPTYIQRCGGDSGGGGVTLPPINLPPHLPPYMPPNNQEPGGGGGGVIPPHDWGQDIPLNMGEILYNGVRLNTKYKDESGLIVPVDDSLLTAYKLIIDNSDFRDIISAYLPPNTSHLLIAFDISITGGKFDRNTNTIFINPNRLKDLGMLEMVNILVHEALHAMFFKPTTTMQSQLTNARVNLVNHYNSLPSNNPLYNINPSENMIHHEAMGLYYKNKVISILRAFHNSSLGKIPCCFTINDIHFEGTFLYSLIQVDNPDPSKTDMIEMWISELDNRNPYVQVWLAFKADEIRNLYLNP